MNDLLEMFDLLSKVNSKVEECCTLLKWTPPEEIDLDFCTGRSAGWARVNRNRSGVPLLQLRINLDLCKTHLGEILSQTVPHEVAHLYTDWMAGRRCKHGFEWQVTMIQLGVSPKRTHDMPVVAAPRRAQRRFAYWCSCKEHKVSKVLHNRMLRGQRRVCTSCKTVLRNKDETKSQN